MAGTITCACGKEYRWKSEYAGKRAKCKCGGVVAFPAGDPAEAGPPPVPDLPEGFEDSYAVAADAPPPPPPPIPGRGAAITPPPVSGAAASRGGFKDSTKAGGGSGGFHWNWKAALNVLIGLGLVAFGLFEFADIGRREAAGQEIHFTGRRSGWMTLMYSIGGRWGVLGFFALVGVCMVGGAVLVMLGKLGSSDHEA